MTTHAIASFQLAGWDEKTWDGQAWNAVTGRKLTHAVVKRQYQGDLQGEGSSHLLMFYRDDGTASYLGLEEIVGSLGGKSGSFVVQHMGHYADRTATDQITVVAGSGTGELAGLRGSGSSAATGDQAPYPITLDYDLG
jgi:hypothetical protein